MVSFQPSEDQQLIRETVAAFAREQMRPQAHDADEGCAVPSDIIQQGWDLGLVQSAIPEEFGGAGDTRSVVTGALIAEELAWGDLSIALHLLAPRLVVYPVLEMGTAEQKVRVLKPYAGAQFRPGTAAVMEPRFDFDLAALTATARRENGAYVVNGAKCYVPLGDDAEHLLVYARTDDRDGYESVSGFLVEKGTAGITVVERERNMGVKALATHEMRLE